MRLALTVPFSGIPLTELPPLVRRAERAGYESVWSQEATELDGFTPLTVAALNTERMRLVTGIVSVYTRGPTLLAQSATALSELSDGRIYVRYLPKGTKIGVQQPFPTVGTYPVADAFSAVKVIAQRPGASQIDLSNGGIAVTDPAHPTSVYIAYPNGKVEVEVFDPSPDRARQLVRTGVIVPVA